MRPDPTRLTQPEPHTTTHDSNHDATPHVTTRDTYGDTLTNVPTRLLHEPAEPLRTHDNHRQQGAQTPRVTCTSPHPHLTNTSPKRAHPARAATQLNVEDHKTGKLSVRPGLAITSKGETAPDGCRTSWNESCRKLNQNSVSYEDVLRCPD